MDKLDSCGTDKDAILYWIILLCVEALQFLLNSGKSEENSPLRPV
jgi:hypothetical protein